jgi:hypothetical protein
MTLNLPPPPGPEQPLWRHMHYAACTCTGWPSASAAIAAELFEVAERIVPLEPKVISDSAPDCPIWARWDERRRIRELLAAEANTAWLHSKPPATICASTGEA